LSKKILVSVFIMIARQIDVHYLHSTLENQQK